MIIIIRVIGNQSFFNCLFNEKSFDIDNKNNEINYNSINTNNLTTISIH